MTNTALITAISVFSSDISVLRPTISDCIISNLEFSPELRKKNAIPTIMIVCKSNDFRKSTISCIYHGLCSFSQYTKGLPLN